MKIVPPDQGEGAQALEENVVKEFASRGLEKFAGRREQHERVDAERR